MGPGRDVAALRRDGRELPVEVTLTPLALPDGSAVLASVVDITERKRAAERLALAVEAAPNAMILVSADGRIAMVNSQVERVFGWPRDELLGQPIETLVPVRFRAGHPAHRDAFFRGPSTRPMGGGRDLYGVRKDGTELPVEIGLNPIQTADGFFVLAAVIDITQRKQAERQLLASLAEKEALLKEIHHRVKNNLQTISSLLHLQGRRTDSEEARWAITESVRRIQSIALVHETLSREAGEEVAFTEIMRPLVQMVSEAVSSPERTITFEVVGDAGTLPAQVATPMAVVLTELLQNTADHAFPATARQAVPARVCVELERSESELVVRVVDNGVGVPEGFEIAKAKGLGLSIVRALVESDLRGRIDLDVPESGYGTSITVGVPLETFAN